MKLRMLLSNRHALSFLASYLQHFDVTPPAEWFSIAFARAKTPFVISELTGLRADQVSLEPAGWRERWALIKMAFSQVRKDDA